MPSTASRATSSSTPATATTTATGSVTASASATHEMPSLGVSAPETPLPSPTVFSVEPGVYLDDVTGVRIEDLVLFDAGAAVSSG